MKDQTAASAKRKPHDSDLTNAQWSVLEPILLPPKRRGRPRKTELGANRREPNAGHLIRGPHVHFPTSAFSNISGRGRSRAYAWEVDTMLPLNEVARLFARHVNIVGNPDILERFGDAPNESQ